MTTPHADPYFNWGCDLFGFCIGKIARGRVPKRWTVQERGAGEATGSNSCPGDAFEELGCDWFTRQALTALDVGSAYDMEMIARLDLKVVTSVLEPDITHSLQGDLECR